MINSSKNKFKNIADEDSVLKRAVRPDLLDGNLIKKVKDTVIGSRATWWCYQQEINP